jgi:GntR family transcriptional repressor for pyruvate dehydrogenase complex
MTWKGILMGAQPLRPVEKTTAYEAVVRQMVGGIASGLWQPGDKLPSERKLMQTLKVGRTSIREALRACEALGLVEVRQGEGAYVKSTPHIVVPEVTLSSLVSDSSQLIKLFEVRELLEPQATALAAQRRDEEQLKALEQTLRNIEDADEDSAQIVDLDLQFHMQIAEMAENDLLLEFERVILEAMQWSWVDGLAVPGRPSVNVEESRKIFEAIRDMDAERARVVSLQHVRGGREAVLKRYRERLRSAGNGRMA